MTEVLASRLFARPSFFDGFARVVDLPGSLNRYNVALTGEDADRQALEHDWRRVTAHLREALARLADAEPET